MKIKTKTLQDDDNLVISVWELRKVIHEARANPCLDFEKVLNGKDFSVDAGIFVKVLEDGHRCSIDWVGEIGYLHDFYTGEKLS